MKAINRLKENLLLLLFISLVSWSCGTKKTVVNQSPVEEKEVPPAEIVVIPAEAEEKLVTTPPPSATPRPGRRVIAPPPPPSSSSPSVAPSSSSSPEIETEAPPPPPPPPPYGRGEIFKVVEDMPRFPGCEHLNISRSEKSNCAKEKLQEYINSQLQYPKMAKDHGVEGTCVVTFIVQKNGQISDVRIMRDVGAGCGQEAMRIVQSMKEDGISWKPGTQRGQAVNVQLTIPIKFSLP